MEVLAGIIAAATPLVYATAGATISEKAGVVNLSLDGSILLSAMVAFAAAFTTNSVIVGYAAGAAVSMVVAALVAFSSIELRLNQIAVGFVLFLLARQLALFLGDDGAVVVLARDHPPDDDRQRPDQRQEGQHGQPGLI